MDLKRKNILRLVRRNIQVASQILYTVPGGESEAGIHILRAWFAIAALYGEQGNQPGEFSAEHLRPLAGSKLIFTKSLPKDRWQEELELLATECQSISGECSLSSWQLLEHCDLLRRTLTRIRKGTKSERGKFVLPGLPEWLGASLRSVNYLSANFWYAIFGLVIAGIAIFSIRPMLIEGGEKPWRAEYYAGINLAGSPRIVRAEEHVDFDWTHSHPRDFPRKGYYSVRFDTCLRLKRQTQAAFELGSDDGARMFVDGKKVIDGWRTRSMTVDQASLQLSPGVHHLRVEYFEKGGSAIIRMRAKLDHRGFRNLSDRDIFYPGDELVDPQNPCKS